MTYNGNYDYCKSAYVNQWRSKVPKSVCVCVGGGGGGGGGGGTQTRDLCTFGKEPICTSYIWIYGYLLTAICVSLL